MHDDHRKKYPKDLIPEIKKRWPKGSPELPPDAILETFLEEAYHASFEVEEQRRYAFRAILCSPWEYDKWARSEYGNTVPSFSPSRFRLVGFRTERLYNAAEIKKLAPACEAKRHIICVKAADKGLLKIWGILDVGENWWKFTHHQVNIGYFSPPNYPMVSGFKPGEISASAGDRVLISLKAGEFSQPIDILLERTFMDFFCEAHREIHGEVLSRLRTKRFDPGEDLYGENYPKGFYVGFIKRILFNAKLRNHGGTIIIIHRHYAERKQLDKLVSIKYRSEYDYAWGLIVSNLVKLRKLDRIRCSLYGDSRLTQKYLDLDEEFQHLNEAIEDVCQTIASFTAIDGAVIMTDHLKVLGFGAEIIAPDEPQGLLRVTDAGLQPQAPDDFGTRHRSAFRFCSSCTGSVAFVLSQDGGVKAVKRVGKDVRLWPDVIT